ncbi:MAG TPA: ScpA family protein [Alphaproteobacteria bacterium]|jgi:segregation and condensation protein A
MSWDDPEKIDIVEPDPEDRLILNLEGYEGPLDLLLLLARDQKVDLTQISILQLADQYLQFIERVGREQLELAADYLVMAAWLAYMKSRLLLPKSEEDEEPSGAEMAAALAFQLQRLEAIREVGARMMARPQLGREMFARGQPETIDVIRKPVYEVSLYELLKVYSEHLRRGKAEPLTIAPTNLYSVEDALKRLSRLLGNMPDWHILSSFLPPDFVEGIGARSALASTLVASLELAKSGRAVLRQDRPFGPIFVRGKRDGE